MVVVVLVGMEVSVDGEGTWVGGWLSLSFSNVWVIGR